MILKSEFRQIECAVKPLMPQHIADQKVDLIFHDFACRFYVEYER